MRQIRRPDKWYLAGALLILAVVSLLTYQAWEAYDASAPLIQRDRAVLQQIVNVVSSLKDAETGQRGFVLTGNQEYLQDYSSAIAALPAQLRALSRSATGDPALSTRIVAITDLAAEKLAELKETVEVRQREGFQAALTVVETDRGKRAMDDIRNVADDLQNQVYTELNENIRERQRQASRTQLTTALGAAVLFTFLLLATIDIGRTANQRDALIARLAAANDQTAASRDLLHTTLASIGDAVITTDEKGNVTFLNGVAEYLTGWIQADAERKPLQQVLAIVNEETRNTVESPVDKALREGVVVGLANHTLLISRDGTERPIDDSAAPIRDPRGKIVGVVMVFRDVSARRESEEHMRQLNRDLRRTNQDLQQFSYAASHDLKEPLRTVSNYLQLIRARYAGKVLDGEAADLFEVAVAGAQRMHALVEALLEYSRAGEVADDQLQPVPVQRAVENAIANLTTAVTEANANLVIGTLPVVTANELHLTQVFENLIGNALKYRSKELPRISITANESAHEWTFSVEDNGIGIPLEYQAQIFGIFKRLHGSEYPGTGIGLATCQKIVDRHGGTIWVESMPGKGARFSFTLPRGAHSSPLSPHQSARANDA